MFLPTPAQADTFKPVSPGAVSETARLRFDADPHDETVQFVFFTNDHPGLSGPVGPTPDYKRPRHRPGVGRGYREGAGRAAARGGSPLGRAQPGRVAAGDRRRGRDGPRLGRAAAQPGARRRAVGPGAAVVS